MSGILGGNLILFIVVAVLLVVYVYNTNRESQEDAKMEKFEIDANRDREFTKEQNKIIIEDINRSLSLGKERTRAIIENIEINNNQTIPAINQTLSNISSVLDEFRSIQANRTLQQDNNDFIHKNYEVLVTVNQTLTQIVRDLRNVTQ